MSNQATQPQIYHFKEDNSYSKTMLKQTGMSNEMIEQKFMPDWDHVGYLYCLFSFNYSTTDSPFTELVDERGQYLIQF